MAEIQDGGEPGQIALKEGLPLMADEELIAQDLVQQGAIHAVSYMLSNGCTEDIATMMLKSLRENATMIREEAVRRGKPSIFTKDQTVFN